MSTYSPNYTPPAQQLAPPPPGSNGSLYSSAGAITKNNATSQNNLNKIGGSRRHMRFKGGATDSIVVTPMRVPYPETGRGDQTTSANVTNSTKVGASLNANQQYDACVGQGASCGMSGGKKLAGGLPNWRCMSGGKSRRRKTRKTKKNRRRKSRRRKVNKYI
jgi:hypothetical protein